MGARGVRRRLHDPLHDVPHPPGGAVGRHPRRPGLLARPAARRPRRRAAGTSTSSSCSAWSGRCCCSARSARCRAAPPDAPARLPDLGVRALAGRLLVGEREVRLARDAPAAAAAAARRPRPAGDLGRARPARRQARPRRRDRLRGLRGLRSASTSTRCTAPTRASCSSPRSPRRRSSGSPSASWRRPRPAERDGRPFPIVDRHAPTARRSRGPGTSATSRAATST